MLAGSSSCRGTEQGPAALNHPARVRLAEGRWSSQILGEAMVKTSDKGHLASAVGERWSLASMHQLSAAPLLARMSPRPGHSMALASRQHLRVDVGAGGTIPHRAAQGSWKRHGAQRAVAPLVSARASPGLDAAVNGHLASGTGPGWTDIPKRCLAPAALSGPGFPLKPARG